MMPVIDTMIKRSQLGGRRSHLADEITTLYFNQNNNAKTGLKKDLTDGGSCNCVECLQGSSSEEKPKAYYSTLKLPDHMLSYRRKSHKSSSDKSKSSSDKSLRKKELLEKKAVKIFNKRHSHSHSKRECAYNAIIAGELAIINSKNSLLSQTEEQPINHRTDLTPPEYKRITEYCNGVIKTHIQMSEAVKLLADIDKHEDAKNGGDKMIWLHSCCEGLKHVYTKTKTIVINHCSCCICKDKIDYHP